MNSVSSKGSTNNGAFVLMNNFAINMNLAQGEKESESWQKDKRVVKSGAEKKATTPSLLHFKGLN